MRNASSGPGADWVVESECDLRVGGEWIIRFGPSSAPYVERNVFHTVERPHRLVYASTTEWPDGSHVESLMEISLQWLDGRTFLTLTLRGSPPATSNEGSLKAGTSSWTGWWPGSRHGPRPERARGGEGCDGQGHVGNLDVA
jgi:uncharacterized protein YndB with AHSA1/START domain